MQTMKTNENINESKCIFVLFVFDSITPASVTLAAPYSVHILLLVAPCQYTYFGWWHIGGTLLATFWHPVGTPSVYILRMVAPWYSTLSVLILRLVAPCHCIYFG